ncbi:DUF2937 family protein [Propylenella binzhouense]|uniref:DUF2937 family protein n=1 Tax=Propylenella binzhouense TaxID=2555902 RepID=A0A964T8Q1_9HYPH|nr:DUF2937 family protein [Propylenella binzhouense]
MIRRAVVLAAALAGGLATSQFPEFAQQYRQRLGGALDEIRQVVADLDADAGRNRLTREEALRSYGSEPGFLRDRGLTMAGVVRRYETLMRQREDMEAVPPALRPVIVLRSPDARVVEGAWADFEPAVPVTAAGFLWAALGLLAGALFAWLLLLPFRRRKRMPAVER